MGGEARRVLVKWILTGGPNVDGAVAEWARRTIGCDGWDKYTTMSLWDDMTILAAVIYEGYTTNNLAMHVAATPGKHWLNRRFLRAAFAYPFLQLRVDRVTGVVPDSNAQAKKFDEHLGFIREGVIRRGSHDGSDLIIYGMLREECRFLEMKDNGKALAHPAAPA